VTVELPNLPYVAAMIILILILVALQQRQPRIAIGSWLIGLSFVLAGQMSGYFLETVKGPWYQAPHIFRLWCDMLAGMIFMLYTGRPLPRGFHRTFLPLWNAIPLLMLEILYGLDIQRPEPYIACAIIAAAVCFGVAADLRMKWTVPAGQSASWAVIAIFATFGDYRAAAYWGLGVVYASAALHLWLRLRAGTLGRLIIVGSLSVWSLSFLLHPWVFHMPVVGPMAEIVWTMQKFFVTLGMFIVLLEDKARENEHLAHHDELTGLANRRLMEQRLHTAIANGRANILILDLNGFKAINDTYGHHAGDLLLQLVTQRLQPLIGPGETLARLGGDEFVIISPNSVELLIDAIRVALSQEVALADVAGIKVNVAIGAALFPGDIAPGTPEEIASHLLRLADHRMYLDKQPRPTSTTLTGIA
jgi:diguanylate cyclase